MARADLVSAGLRHVRDAEHLLAAGPDQSVDQALHLAGFGPECLRKGCIDEPIADKALGHEFRTAGDPVVDFLVALDPSASRYGLETHAAALPQRALHWDASCRYSATGSTAMAAATAVVVEARAFVDLCVMDLWSDGSLPHGSLR